MYRACSDTHTKFFAQCHGNFLISPATLPESTDELVIWIEFAQRGTCFRTGEEIGDLLFRIHAETAVSTFDGIPGRSVDACGGLGLEFHADSAYFLAMPPWVTFVISILALAISAITAWLTFFRRGRLMMTQPTTVFFGPDGPTFDGGSKIFLRTLLYSTAKRGQVVESLHVALHRNESKQNFNVWVYGEKDALHRGSGLFVPQEGVTFNHHFLQPRDGANCLFLAGSYRLVVFAKLVGAKEPTELACIRLSISEAHAAALAKGNTGIYFDWGPDLQDYYAHLDARPEDRIGTPFVTALKEFVSVAEKAKK